MLEYEPRQARIRPRPRASARGARARRIAVLTAALALGFVVISYGLAMASPSSLPLGVRTVEWLRDNGLRGVVNEIETIYYSWEAPSKGGPALRALPKQPGSRAQTAPRASNQTGQSGPPVIKPAYRPPAIKPLITPALAGEGIWRSTFHGDGVSTSPVLITSFRSDPSYPQTVAGVAWIDQKLTTTWLYAGRVEPAVQLPSRGAMEVPATMRSRLVATFNSAFQLADSGGGVVLHDHTWAPMKDGVGTIVRYANGRIDVIDWTGGSTAPSNVVWARQNLPLIVEDRRPNPNLSNGPEWGATLGNAIQVWRSAVGVDSHGNLIYAAANYQTVGSLAAVMIHAGAVRAMELDINAEWPSFITYTGPDAAGAANFLPGMAQSPERYLTPDDRDFFAVYLK
jgi:hypothetical protein